MNEIILNIYLIINNGYVTEYRAVAYEMEGGDDNKIAFLRSKAVEDFDKGYRFDAFKDRYGRFLKYHKFAKMEDKGKHADLYEEIFSHFDIPDNPIICVTPVVDGKIITTTKDK
jgi:hypothetical protein